MSLTIQLEVQEIQFVLESLKREPFGSVADLWFKIKSQAEAQLVAEQQAPRPEEPVGPAPEDDQA